MALQWHQLGCHELMDIIIIVRPVLSVLATRHLNINHRHVITIIPPKCVAAILSQPYSASNGSCLSLEIQSRVIELHHFLLYVRQHGSSSHNRFERYEMFTAE